MMIDDIRIVIEKGSLTADEAAYYVDRLKSTSKFPLKRVTFQRSDNYIDVRCAFKEIPFERLRRIPLTSQDEKRAVNH